MLAMASSQATAEEGVSAPPSPPPLNNLEVALPAGEDVQILDVKQSRWLVNAPLLYDYFLNVPLTWPALCVSWLPDIDDQLPRLAFGTNSDQNQNEVVVCQLQAEQDLLIEENGGWKTWICDPGAAGTESRGFGLNILDGWSTPLSTIARLRHPTEVNKVAPCPHRPRLLATKAANGSVCLFDSGKERSPHDGPDATFEPPEPVDGFALCWSVME